MGLHFSKTNVAKYSQNRNVNTIVGLNSEGIKHTETYYHPNGYIESVEGFDSKGLICTKIVNRGNYYFKNKYYQNGDIKSIEILNSKGINDGPSSYYRCGNVDPYKVDFWKNGKIEKTDHSIFEY
jgi:hypothetical protein